jgi:hypothetical protein
MGVCTMKKPGYYSIGDTILTRHGVAKIEVIEKTTPEDPKYGDSVEEIPVGYHGMWVVSMDNGHWTYGQSVMGHAEEIYHESNAIH